MSILSINTHKKYTAPPIAAAAAIIPTFYGFSLKSSRQLEQAKPAINFKNSIIAGIKTAPIIAVIAGTQIIAQEQSENKLNKWGYEDKKTNLVLSSFAVSVVSVPFLSIFSGRTLTPPLTLKESLQRLNCKQAGAICGREFGFLLSLQGTELFTDYIKNKINDHPIVHYGTTFLSGAIPSMITHPLDTILVRSQVNMPTYTLRSCYFGLVPRVITMGLFNVLYQGCKKYYLE